MKYGKLVILFAFSFCLANKTKYPTLINYSDETIAYISNGGLQNKACGLLSIGSGELGSNEESEINIKTEKDIKIICLNIEYKDLNPLMVKIKSSPNCKLTIQKNLKVSLTKECLINDQN